MTLKEKFTEILYKQSQDDSECLRIRFENIDKVIDSQQKIADEFAIGFAEWLSMFTQEFEDGDLRYWNKDRWERKSIKELLEIYKKEKQNESNFSR
jgi:hypothetical protein